MTFLAHEIPWDSFASNFQHGRTPKKDGPHYRDFFLQYRGEQSQRMEYFATTLNKTIREHAVIERRKLRSAKAYSDRAQDWNTSNGVSINSIRSENVPAIPDEMEVRPDTVDSLLRAENQRIRDLQRSLESGFAPGPERREIYNDKFIAKYGCHAGDEHGHGFLQKDIGRNVAEWLETERPRFSHRRDGDHDRQLSDVIKLLIVEASILDDLELARQSFDTMLLMVHHPNIQIESYQSLGMDCCNYHCGYDNLARLTLDIFLYLNLVIWHIDHGDQSLQLPADEVSQRRCMELPQFHNPHSQYPNFRMKGYIACLKNLPAYMTTPSWQKMVNKSVQSHEHLAETSFFRNIFFPRVVETEQRAEVDLLADMTRAQELLKLLWRILISTEVILRESGRPFNWEYMVLEHTNNMFHTRKSDRVPNAGWGWDWVSYDMERSGWGSVGSDDKTAFNFCQYELQSRSWPEGVNSGPST